MLRILHFARRCTQLLTKLHRTCRAIFHAFAAGNTILRLHFCNISRAGHIRCVEQLRSTQCIANIYVAVADGNDLIISVHIGDLMNKAIFLRLLQDAEYLLPIHIMTTVSLHHKVCHIAQCDTPVFRIIRTALSQYRSAHAAGAGTGCITAIVLFQPVRNLFNALCVGIARDRFFYRNNMHADSGTAQRNHRCDLFQWQERHTLKKIRQMRIFLHVRHAHVGIFAAAHNEYRQNIQALMLRLCISKLQ